MAKLAVGGVITLGVAVPITLTVAGPAWAYGPTSAGTTSSSTVPAHVASAAATSSSSSGGLAFTGADVTGALGVAAVAIAGGGTLVVASRRRRSNA
jgi:chemotaxis response regulator CheB